MKKPFKVFLEEDEFDFDRCVEIVGDSDNKEHTIRAYINENNYLVLNVQHELYESYGCECGCGEFQHPTTILTIPLDELM